MPHPKALISPNTAAAAPRSEEPRTAYLLTEAQAQKLQTSAYFHNELRQRGITMEFMKGYIGTAPNQAVMDRAHFEIEAALKRQGVVNPQISSTPIKLYNGGDRRSVLGDGGSVDSAGGGVGKPVTVGYLNNRSGSEAKRLNPNAKEWYPGGKGGKGGSHL